MSRVGKQPVPVPSGVTVTVSGNVLKVKGPKGELEQSFDPDFKVEAKDGELVVDRPSDQKRHRAFHGLYRALFSNMVVGVSTGFTRVLEVEGVGYSAQATGSKLTLNVGYNAPVEMEVPKGVDVATPKNTVIEISGYDKQKVGQFAAVVRKVRPPEPYKGKGIRYKDEHVRRKAGKAIGGKA
ncbi:MAG: 50S ribosomal protein L6 [Planctomycetes bacterium]|nr:50S ribosomal protein L6 [Planctomycetota bacterium]